MILPNLNYNNNLINGSVNGSVKKLSDRDVDIYKTIKKNPGIRSTQLLDLLKQSDPDINLNIFKKRIKLMSHLIEFKGPSKTGGYYIKK